MKPRFLCESNPSAERLRQELDRVFGVFGETSVTTPIGNHSIATTETKVRHGLGSIPNGWREYSPQGPGRVYQTQPPDRTNLYLAATVAVIVGLEVF
jgi:hypothetical protein